MLKPTAEWREGVTIDSIYSSYYGPRYWGAVRIG